MVSKASSKLMLGSRVGKRLANMDFPDPGGPTSIMLCPPAAAISKARFTANCPLTSLKSTGISKFACSYASMAGAFAGELVLGSFKKFTTWVKLDKPYTSRPSITEASEALISGTMIPLNPSSRACRAIANTPRVA